MPGGWRTEKQAAVLRKNGLNSEVPFDQASQMIDQLKRNGWGKGPQQPQQYGAPQNQGYMQAPPPTQTGGYPPQGQYQAPPQQNNGGCTAKQAGVLAKYGYPTNVSFDTASQIIDQLKANNWQPVPNGTAAQHQAPMQQGFVPPAPSYPPPAATQQYVPQPQQFMAPPATQYAAPAPAAGPVPQFQNGQNAPWEAQPQFAGVPNFG